MRHLVIRISLVTVLGFVGTILGTFVAVFFTPAGRGLAGRALAERVSQLLRGDIQVSAVGGTLLTGLDLDGLVIRDTSGELLADIPHVTLRYRLPELLAGRIVLQRLDLDQPLLHIVKHRDGRMNYEEVLRLGEGNGSGAGTLVSFQRVGIRNGTVELDLPWSPPDSMRTPDRAARALLIDRSRPGRVIEPGPEGYHRRIRFTQLTARFPLMRLGTPDHKPVQFIVDTLATHVSDPAVTVTDLNGSIEIDGTTLTFRLARAGLPHSAFAGQGKLTWPEGPVLYDFQLGARRLDLTDLRWISPQFPAMSGHAIVTARSRSTARTDYQLDSLSLAGADGRVAGRMTALVDDRRGIGADQMALTLTDLDLDVARPYLDTLPFHGTITGTLAGGGFLDSLDVDLDWLFHDDRVAGRPASHVSAVGHLAFGGPDGTVFDTLTLRSADLDLRTVRLVSPTVPLNGHLVAQGFLAGPWDDVTFDGTAVHQDGALPASTVVGGVRLDTRTPATAFAADVMLQPLVLDGIRPSFPGLVTRGALRGHVALSGSAARMQVDADLNGDVGRIRATGGFGTRPAGWEVDSLDLAFQALDLRPLLGHGPATSLTGRAFTDGILDSAQTPEGIFRTVLAPGSVGSFTFDTVIANLRSGAGILRLDTLALAWDGGVAGGTGALGWTGPVPGSVSLSADIRDLRSLDSLIFEATGWHPDSGAAAQELAGRLSAEAQLSGSVDSLVASGTARAGAFTFRGVQTPAATANFSWSGGLHPRLSLRAASDTLSLSGFGFSGFSAAIAGRTDSLSWRLGTGIGPGDSVRASGAWHATGSGNSVTRIDTLVAALTAHTWRLSRPATLSVTDAGVGFDTARLVTDDGAGEARVAGATPGAAQGGLVLHLLDLDLRDLAGLFARDTIGVRGQLSTDLEIGGTAAQPTIRGTASLADAGFGAFQGPYAQAVVNYGGQRLDLGLTLWRTGRPVLTADAHLPVDLAFASVNRRLIDGPLNIRVQADSADVGMLEAFTPNARQLRGGLTADAGVEGTWNDPRLTGTLQVRDGGVSLPALGVRYDRINGSARLSGDSIVLDTLTLRGGEGTLAIGGGVRLERLTRPILDLDLTAKAFRAMDVRNYLTLLASGHLKLTGPFFGATLSGRATADQGALYFADLVTKQVVDLSDPATAQLLDTALVRDAQLGPSIENRFLDSLSISNFRLAVGDEFWLRSTEANIRLTGDVTVNKTARNYRLDGTLKADRGNYALKVGFITRPFTVQSGTVQFLGTPDLNAELDIQAVHTVKPADGTADIPIVAHITGTTLAPKLALASPQNPTLSETELVSYLMFGRPSFALDQTAGATPGGESAALQTGIAYLSSALSTEIERALVSDLGVPVDFVEIRPGGAGGSFVNPNAGLTTLSAGWRIGNRTFFTFNAGLCPNLGQLSYKSFGASIEQRFNAWVRAQASVEPVVSCQPNVAVDALGATNQYQLGFDLLWEREY